MLELFDGIYQFLHFRVIQLLGSNVALYVIFRMMRASGCELDVVEVSIIVF